MHAIFESNHGAKVSGFSWFPNSANGLHAQVPKFSLVNVRVRQVGEKEALKSILLFDMLWPRTGFEPHSIQKQPILWQVLDPRNNEFVAAYLATFLGPASLPRKVEVEDPCSQ